MILLLSGASHTGKTLVSQRLMEQYHMPYFSIDHLKMGLIRSGHTDLTPYSHDDDLTAYLWPIVREMVKTAVENGQSLIVEGCYIPFDWKKDFAPEYLAHIRALCLVMSRTYLKGHFGDVKAYANAIERRLEDDLDLKTLICENERNLALCRKHGWNYILIEEDYRETINKKFPIL